MSLKTRYVSYLINLFLFSTPLVFIPSLPSWGQLLPTDPEIGFEVEGQSELNQIVVPLFRYVGECPSSKIYAGKVKAWFTSSTQPPRKDRKVIIRNISRGMSPDNFPFTERDYSKGRSAESTDITFGTQHRDSTFVIRDDNNEFEYEIRENNSVVERGQFSAVVNRSSTVSEVYREATEVDKGYCAEKGKGFFSPCKRWVSNKVRECPKD
ncbi:hypothetical protein A0J48_014665 [Sphaerospermopsis aphanizomenoides BCCUSP55]|uniref:hypothetical protein n=1 Tax=Sphaerospermopsis aphanizomenoides TaxID=459663 RepID=UPI001905DD09|nr:hypothetical protein [Sphaerospermopsis aphanizomenoides]MBK1988764.1 hypothetical protein [Sphaerospermopsis aphanizomenoides BCCUSP55]